MAALEDDTPFQYIVSALTTSVMEGARAMHFKTCGDDRAAELEAAIYTYLKACQE